LPIALNAFSLRSKYFPLNQLLFQFADIRQMQSLKSALCRRYYIRLAVINQQTTTRGSLRYLQHFPVNFQVRFGNAQKQELKKFKK
jgi:hypothetical protein